MLAKSVSRQANGATSFASSRLISSQARHEHKSDRRGEPPDAFAEADRDGVDAHSGARDERRDEELVQAIVEELSEIRDLALGAVADLVP